MVTFEVLQSPDIEKVGTLVTHYEHFTLGNSKKADLYFEDELISPIHLSFIHIKDGLLIKSGEDSSYITNGKKFRGSKIHKLEDTIKVGNTELKITQLAFENLSESFKDLYEKRLKEDPDLESLITQVQKELIYLENNKDV